MPIHCAIEPGTISKDEYHRIDYDVMGIVFDIHNELGRLCDEKIYQNELAGRCAERNLRTSTEVPLKVSHDGFEKTYLIDLIIENRVLYELKAVDTISSQHRQQTLHYMFLSGFQYGKLVNMRPPSVQMEYVTTTLTHEERYQFDMTDDAWKDIDKRSLWLRELVFDLLRDWGAFLDVRLFSEAISFFQNNGDHFETPVEITNDSRMLGEQKVHLLTPETAIHLSTVNDSAESYEKHLWRFLSHTSLRAIQWINFNRHRVLMKTIMK